MFGLTVVRKKYYLNLEKRIKDLEVLLAEKNAIINSLEQELKDYREHYDAEERERKEQAYLITDVAETPLKVEKKPRVSRKTSQRKKIVKKSE